LPLDQPVSGKRLTYVPMQRNRGMNWTQHLHRLAGALIVMIACLIASPAAYAYAGHDHAAEVTRSITVNTDASQDDTAYLVIEGQAEVSTALPAAKRCLGGCCTSSHACCAASLPVNPGALTAPDVGPRDTFIIEPHSRTGFDPEVLRKPPRSFA
jgi:hypothetical protein